MAQPATTRIQLTPRETRLKALLLDAAQHVDRLESLSEPVVLRWAGGWVRDKLLGIESHDIDTAINVMTGEQFGTHMGELSTQPEFAEKHSIGPKDIGNLHKIAMNPEKSKHLETATVKLLGFDVDFVNLRKETYTEDSRNPQMQFGTAEEDALRRDATVNALFYNLNTGLVEDFTGGLVDMDRKVIKTPLEPFQTFMDDPLRVLRLIRFASRLDFSIDPEAERVMSDHRVLEALNIKISRERIGVEVEKMLKGNHPRTSLGLIRRLGLYHTVFTDPTNPEIPTPDITNLNMTYELLDQLRQNRTPGSIYDVLVRSEEAAYFAWVLAAIAPWHSIPRQEQQTRGKPLPPYATVAIREGIKAPNKLCDVTTAADQNFQGIITLKRAVCDGADFLHERDRFGMALRSWEDTKGGNWRLQVLSAVLNEASGVVVENVTGLDEYLLGWQKFLDHLQELDVMGSPSLKRLLDGTQLAKALGQKPGKWLAAALDVVTAWQLRNPKETDPAGAIEEVRARKGELGIP